NKLTEIETTYFVSACYKNGMSLGESAALTKAIVRFGGKLEFNKKPIVDIHSIGGVPGNRITMVVVPIIAAAGFYIPKTSTRSITSPSGTSDTMEVLAPVAHSREKIMEIVEKTNGCMVWGGTLDLASADDKLIKIERPLSLDPEGILLASIVAKKAAAGCTHFLLELPIGEETKLKTKAEAQKLAKKFEALTKKVGMKIKIRITDGSQPIGNGIGPALEARDVLEVLEGKGPGDLREQSLMLAADLLEMVNVKQAREKAEEILDSGKAMEKMREIIKAQGGNPDVKRSDIKIGMFAAEIKAEKKGKVKISNKETSKVAKAAGSPGDKGAGIYLHAKSSAYVEKGDILYTIYSESGEKLEEAKKLAKEAKAVKVI
ncbi:thymidine phosphorylase, partial [Candidatus Woesearchaeota archaeon]|nr:thymidine phosphorylase [Candidatus Woesearchaeota archaeon]